MTDYDLFGQILADSVTIVSGNTATQLGLLRSQWPSAVGRKFRLRNLTASQASGLPATLLIWDQDLSSATPVGRGSGTANGALMMFGIGDITKSGSVTTLLVSDNVLPEIEFEAGVCVLATQPGTNVVVEVKAY